MVERIIKGDYETGFTQISNEVLRCPKLSAKAKGIYAFIISLPSDWIIHRNDLLKYFKDGRDSFNSGFNELIENEFIKVEKIKNEKGQFERTNYIFNWKGNLFESSTNGFSVYGFPVTTNKDYTNKYILNSEDKLCLSSASSNEEVKEFNFSKDNEINQDDYNILKSNLNSDDYDILKYLDVNPYKLDSYFLNAKFNGMYMDTVGISPCLLLELAKGKQVIKSDIVTESDSKKEKEEVPVEERENNTSDKTGNFDLCTTDKKCSQTQKSGHTETFLEKTTNNTADVKKDALNKLSEKLNLQKGTEYVADNNPPKKAKRTKKAPKELSDLQKIKNHYLENRKKMFEAGNCSTPIDSTNSAVVNQRLNALLDMGVTVEQFYKVFDFAMTDDFCKNTVDYKFMPIIKENVFMRLYNDKNCGAVERVVKPAVPNFKTIKVKRPVCSKCGEELDYQGKCPFCD